jgi:iron complex transport system substrate-binding protein
VRIVSHTCSNTEIVCALGAAELLVGVDADSDHPAEIVAGLPKLGRDLSLDIAATLALKPDLVLTSRTLPGHDPLVLALEAAGLRTLVCEPLRLADVYADIARIAEAIGRASDGRQLVARLREELKPRPVRGRRPRLLLEWWPKPVITPTRDSWGQRPGKSTPLSDAEIFEAAPEIVVMSWCGVKVENYRAELVRRRPGWQDVPAVRSGQIHAISEEFLGRPGPRLVQGYQALRRLIEAQTP